MVIVRTIRLVTDFYRLIIFITYEQDYGKESYS